MKIENKTFIHCDMPECDVKQEVSFRQFIPALLFHKLPAGWQRLGRSHACPNHDDLSTIGPRRDSFKFEVKK